MQKYHRLQHPPIHQRHQLQREQAQREVSSNNQTEYTISHPDDIDLTAKGYK